MVAKIAVSAAVFAIDKPYSYQIPTDMTLLPGQRVMVPFGRANRRCEGVVLAVEKADAAGLKPVERALDPEPLLSPLMLRLAAFMRGRYFCTFYDAIKAMLPAGLWFSVRDSYRLLLSPETYEPVIRRNPEALELAKVLNDLGGQAEYDRLRAAVPDEARLQELLRYLVKKQVVEAETDFLRHAADKTETVVTLTEEPEAALEFARRKQKSAPLQSEVLRLLCSVGSACSKEIRYFTGATGATIRRLEALGLLKTSQREVLRRVRAEGLPPASPIVLNPAQQQVFEGLSAALFFDKKKPALLHGVTGSGKTAVYIRLIRACLDAGRSAMLLVPEIALTPQLMGLMTSHFGGTVAVLHSGLRVGERYDEWKRIRQGSARLVLGTRSAIFAPLCDPGLIILDEEQEHTYKSENSPRYHAREVAIWRGAHENALVLLGSATPAVESMYRAKSGDYTLFTLPERYNGKQLPLVEFADMRQEIRSGNSGSVSAKLLAELDVCRKTGRQAILFLNRRGNSRRFICLECGQAPQCPRCSVSLTYHSANRRFMCHYCGHSQPFYDRCEDCGGIMKPLGAGTQKIEEELREKLPDATVLRMDADTVTAVNNHSAILKKFREENITVLLGTQMVAKGLDFENVTLVGVVDADQSLYVENYRAAETTFSMLTQVVGRAGRGSAEGRALVQTMTPEHRVLRQAARQDYDAFYEMEIDLRRASGMPPFADLLVVSFSGLSEQAVLSGAMLFAGWLRGCLKQDDYRQLSVQVLGPVPAPIARINNRFYYRLTVLGQAAPALRELTAHLMRSFASDKKTKGVSVHADLNPYE